MTTMVTSGARAIVLLTVLLTGLTGCISQHMAQVEQPQALATAQPDKAVVVFLRPSGLGGAIQASVFDVTAGDAQFIGIISSGTKLAHLATPSQHRFMVVGENAGFLDAELAPGKTYHVVVAPRLGLWKARFALEPLAASSQELDSSLAACRWVENSEASRAWAQQNMASVLEKKADYLKQWEAGKDKAALRISDGR